MEKDLKHSSCHEEPQPQEPPPYTEHCANPTTDTTASANVLCPSEYSNSKSDVNSTIITIKHHRPTWLKNTHGCKVERDGPARTKPFVDAVLLPRPCCSAVEYDDFLRGIRDRAAAIFSIRLLDVERFGELLYRSNDGGEDRAVVGDVKTEDGAQVNVDAKNWGAVMGLLLQGKGKLVFEVVDLPTGWAVMESKQSSKHNERGAGNEKAVVEQKVKGTRPTVAPAMHSDGDEVDQQAKK